MNNDSKNSGIYLQDYVNLFLDVPKKDKTLLNKIKKVQNSDKIPDTKKHSALMQLYYNFYSINTTGSFEVLRKVVQDNPEEFFLYSYQNDPVYYLNNKMEFIRFAKIKPDEDLKLNVEEGFYELSLPVESCKVIAAQKTKSRISGCYTDTRIVLPKQSFNLSVGSFPEKRKLGDYHIFIIGAEKIAEKIGKNNLELLLKKYNK